jgi:Flp pilus assembly protein TadD
METPEGKTMQVEARVAFGCFAGPAERRQKMNSSRRRAASVALLGVAFSLCCAAAWRPAMENGQSAVTATAISIDYPLQGSIFPPEITAPTILWHDSNPAAVRWAVEVSFSGSRQRMRFETSGEPMKVREIDTRAGTSVELTPEQASTHTFTPSENDWNAIKQLSTTGRATLNIYGLGAGSQSSPFSSSSVSFSTSKDRVGAPIFYRDVPLMITPAAGNGAIQPLPPSALPLIQWEIRYLAEPKSRTVMENLPTCANCHSFSMDGKTMGLDMDGPRNDKGLYALLPIAKNMTITNRDMLRWASFKEDPEAIQSDPTVKRFGFMSQVSPDGRFVITSIAPPGTKDVHGSEAPGFAAGVVNRLFSMNYKHLDFTQVFFPTRGILAWYDRAQRKLRPLPGADDPEYVQTSAFWSPDGKYLIFSRAKAQDPYPAGAPKPTYANDPNELQIQYDLYKVPFNGGLGGRAVPIEGASQNGMSNNFPKVSPDGRWIVFVQNKTGLLMRPDSRLFIVPFSGGKARLMRCNTHLMNSWHTFSPNGRWLAFSSKGRSPYTQLMLTHIDANGNDSPAIMVENTTAANRAVNIPEFLNVPAGGLEKINPEATEFYRLFNQAYDDIENNRLPQAVEALRGAVARDPSDPLAHYGLATALSGVGQESEALAEYRKACELNPKSAPWLDNLAISLALNGDADEAVQTWEKSLVFKPNDPGAETDLGTELVENGHVNEGLEHLRRAVQLDPNLADAHNHLGLALQQTGQLDSAIAEFQAAVVLLPSSVEFHYNLGAALEAHGDHAAAIAALEQSVELSQEKNWHCLVELAREYEKTGRVSEAIKTDRKALDLAVGAHNDSLASQIEGLLASYQREEGSAKNP